MTEVKTGLIIPKESEIKVNNDGSREFVLPSGKTVIIKPFKFKHIQEAQEIAGTNPAKFMPALIAITVIIDGKKLVMEDVIEMDGWDGLDLMGKFTGGSGK